MSIRKNGSTVGTLLVLLLFMIVFAISIWQMQNRELDAESQAASERTGNEPSGLSSGVSSGESTNRSSQQRYAQSNGWRQVTSAAVPGGIDIFQSGNLDCFRSRMGPRNFRIKDIDSQNFGVLYTRLEDESEKIHFASLRFCRRLTFMGNSRADEFVKILESLPAFEPLSAGAKSIAEPQEDAGFSFTDLSLKTSDNRKLLSGTITNLQKKRIENASFYVVVVDPDDKQTVLCESMMVARSLLPNVPQTFEHFVEFENQDSPLIKIWLEFTTPLAYQIEEMQMK